MQKTLKPKLKELNFLTLPTNVWL